MPPFIQADDVRSAVRALQEAKEALGAALREAEQARSHVQATQAQAASDPEATGAAVEQAGRALEAAHHDAERHRASLQQASKGGQRLLDRLGQAIRATRDDASRLEAARKEVGAGARDVERGAQHARQSVQQLETWQRELAYALDAARSVQHAPVHPGGAASSGAAAAYGAARTSSYAAAPSLDDQLASTPQAYAQRNGTAYEAAAYDASPQASYGPAPAFGRGGASSGESWLEKIVRGAPARAPDPVGPQGLEQAVEGLLTDMTADAYAPTTSTSSPYGSGYRTR